MQSERAHIHDPNPISVASVQGTIKDFLEEMFGSTSRHHSSLEIIGRGIYYHYWDNWNRRGIKAQQKRDDLFDDYRNAKAAFEAGNAKTAKEAMDIARNLMRAGQKYFDLERVYAGENRERMLVELEEEISLVVQSAKERKGEWLTRFGAAPTSNKFTDKTGGANKGMARFLDLIKDPEAISILEEEYRATFNSGAMVDESGDASFDRFLDGFGDLGVAQYARMKYEDLYKRLGLEAFYTDETEKLKVPTFPFLNLFVSRIGELPEDIEGFTEITANTPPEALDKLYLSELRVRWHQLVGACAVVDRCVDGLNVLLADAVGLGKTLICYLAMSYLRHIRLMRGKNFNPPICAFIVFLSLFCLTWFLKFRKGRRGGGSTPLGFRWRPNSPKDSILFVCLTSCFRNGKRKVCDS